MRDKSSKVRDYRDLRWPLLADSNDDGTVQLTCGCGWESPLRFTWEAVGRDLDLHLAQVFPRGTERRKA